MSRVVVIMPVYNEAKHLQSVLDCIAAQDIDRRRLYFVAVDGASTDASAEILRAWFQQTSIAGCVVSNPRRKIATSLNAGLRQATDEDIVVRLDAHAIYGPNYLSEAVSSLERAPADVGCIGGAPIPASGTTFEERVVEALYRNPMGLGPADFRSGDDVREVDQVYLGVWRPGLLGRAGGFNEALDANEDSEMSSRIRRLGYKILRVQLPCRFIANKGVWGSVRQWYRYGYWRCKMLQCNPRSIRPRHLFPPVMSLCLVGLACSPARILLIPLGAAYAVLVYRWRPKDQSLLVTLGTVVFFPAVQAAWALGLFHALLSGAGGVRRSLTPAGTVVAE